MRSAKILAKENPGLCAANEFQKQKRNWSSKRIPRSEGMSIQEVRDLINSPNQAVEASNSARERPAPPVQHRILHPRHPGALIASN